MTSAPAAAASALRQHVLTNQWATLALTKAVRNEFCAEKLAALVLPLHHHAHYDADGAATYDMRRTVTTCCISCGPVTQGTWCPTVSAIAQQARIDLDQEISDLGRNDAIEQLAARHCARLQHSHAGVPHCAGYRAAVEEYNAAQAMT